MPLYFEHSTIIFSNIFIYFYIFEEILKRIDIVIIKFILFTAKFSQKWEIGH